MNAKDDTGWEGCPIYPALWDRGRQLDRRWQAAALGRIPLPQKFGAENLSAFSGVIVGGGNESKAAMPTASFGEWPNDDDADRRHPGLATRGSRRHRCLLLNAHDEYLTPQPTPFATQGSPRQRCAGDRLQRCRPDGNGGTGSCRGRGPTSGSDTRSLCGAFRHIFTPRLRRGNVCVLCQLPTPKRGASDTYCDRVRVSFARGRNGSPGCTLAISQRGLCVSERSSRCATPRSSRGHTTRRRLQRLMT